MGLQIVDLNKSSDILTSEWLYKGNPLRVDSISDNTNLIPSKAPIGVWNGGGQLQVILANHEGKKYEAYIYHYTKHGTNNRRYILERIEEKE